MFNLFKLFKKPEPKMDYDDKQVIIKLAQGDKSCREEAIRIHRKWIPVLGVRGTTEQRFMAEIDHSLPDGILRAQYRRELLAEVTRK